MAASTNQRSLSAKLLVDNKTNMVLFAEASKEVIDFLFDLLTIPVGSVVELLTKESMVGCISNLYKSVETIDKSYINIDDVGIRRSLLNPTAAAKITVFLTESSSTTSAVKKYYRCLCMEYHFDCKNYFTDVCGIICPICKDPMTTEISYMGPNSESVAAVVAKVKNGAGFVKQGVTYGVMDDLTVAPMSTISSILMLNKFNVTDVGSLEERIVNLGVKEGLGLLKASLQSKTVLTDVFIGKKLGKKANHH